MTDFILSPIYDDDTLYTLAPMQRDWLDEPSQTRYAIIWLNEPELTWKEVKDADQVMTTDDIENLQSPTEAPAKPAVSDADFEKLSPIGKIISATNPQLTIEEVEEWLDMI